MRFVICNAFTQVTRQSLICTRIRINHLERSFFVLGGGVGENRRIRRKPSEQG